MLKPLNHACFEDIFSFLGVHQVDDNTVCYRVYFPEAEQITLLLNNQEHLFERYQLTDLFYLTLPKEANFSALSIEHSICQIYHQAI